MPALGPPDDAFGAALADHAAGVTAGPELILEVDDGHRTPALPPAWFFLPDSSWSPEEREVLGHAPPAGPVLDLGAGAGRHALWFQSRGHAATPVDASPGPGVGAAPPPRGGPPSPPRQQAVVHRAAHVRQPRPGRRLGRDPRAAHPPRTPLCPWRGRHRRHDRSDRARRRALPGPRRPQPRRRSPARPDPPP